MLPTLSHASGPGTSGLAALQHLPLGFETGGGCLCGCGSMHVGVWVSACVCMCGEEGTHLRYGRRSVRFAAGAVHFLVVLCLALTSPQTQQAHTHARWNTHTTQMPRLTRPPRCCVCASSKICAPCSHKSMARLWRCKNSQRIHAPKPALARWATEPVPAHLAACAGAAAWLPPGCPAWLALARPSQLVYSRVEWAGMRSMTATRLGGHWQHIGTNARERYLYAGAPLTHRLGSVITCMCLGRQCAMGLQNAWQRNNSASQGRPRVLSRERPGRHHAMKRPAPMCARRCWGAVAGQQAHIAQPASSPHSHHIVSAQMVRTAVVAAWQRCLRCCCACTEQCRSCCCWQAACKWAQGPATAYRHTSSTWQWLLKYTVQAGCRGKAFHGLLYLRLVCISRRQCVCGGP